MRGLLRRFFGPEATSAQTIMEGLQRKGIGRDEIAGKHILEVYRRLNVLRGAPDFSAIEELLPRAIPQDLRSAVLGVIVETRQHPALESVVLSFSRELEIPIQLFHGTGNLEFILTSAIGPLVSDGRVILSRLETDRLDASKYNALLLTPAFWTLMNTRGKALVFQTDTILCLGSPYTLGDFLSFDYIGSKWSRQRPIGLLSDGGNGGLSLRDWRKSYECLKRFPPQKWTGGEDGYFAFHIELMGGRVGRDKDCANFSTQYEFLAKSFGAHDISWLDQRSRAAFLDYCPAARFMLES